MMTAIESMEWAEEFTTKSKLFDAPVKSNGYTMDGYKPVRPAERVQIVVDLAREARKQEYDDYLRSLLRNLEQAYTASDPHADLDACIRQLRTVITGSPL